MGIVQTAGKAAGNILKGVGGELFSSTKGWTSATDALTKAVDMVDNAASRMNHKFNKMAGSIVDQAVKLDQSGAIRQAAEELTKDGTKFTNSELWDKINEKVAPSVIDNLSKNDEVFSKAISEYTSKGNVRKAALEAIEANDKKAALSNISSFLGRENGKIGTWNLGTGFFENAEYGKTRKALAAGAIGAAAIGGRYLSGGNLTTNARGEHDIAGLPFF